MIKKQAIFVFFNCFFSRGGGRLQKPAYFHSNICKLLILGEKRWRNLLIYTPVTPIYPRISFFSRVCVFMSFLSIYISYLIEKERNNRKKPGKKRLKNQCAENFKNPRLANIAIYLFTRIYISKMKYPRITFFNIYSKINKLQFFKVVFYTPFEMPPLPFKNKPYLTWHFDCYILLSLSFKALPKRISAPDSSGFFMPKIHPSYVGSGPNTRPLQEIRSTVLWAALKLPALIFIGIDFKDHPKEAIMAIDYSLSLAEAFAQVEGLRNMAALAGNEPIDYLTGYQLFMLLDPISTRLSEALTNIEAENPGFLNLTKKE